MINLTTANNALKSVYLDVVGNLLNTSTNPLFAKIKQTTKGVYGDEVRVVAPYGINGGIAASTETGELPKTSRQNYVNFVSTLKNLYGNLQISDKAIRASQNNAGAFVNLLNDEMESLVKASALNLSRMLYGNGQGLVAEVKGISADKKTLTVSNVNGLMEGMRVDILDGMTDTLVSGYTGIEIKSVNRANKSITFENTVNITPGVSQVYFVQIQNGRHTEITGIKTFVVEGITSVYGLSKADYPFMKGKTVSSVGELDDMKILENQDFVEETANVKINYIACSAKVRRAYQSYLLENGRNVQMIDLGNGFKALDFYGAPIVSDRFVDEGFMFLLDTDTLTLHQMCDWEWMTDDAGNVLTRDTNYPVYSSTLVKYCELIVEKPNGICMLDGITC